MSRSVATRFFALVLLFLGLSAPAGAQDRLQSMPGYDRYRSMSSQIPLAVKSGALSVTWKDDRSFDYQVEGRYYRYDIASGQAGPHSRSEWTTLAGPAPAPPRANGKDSNLAALGGSHATDRQPDIHTRGGRAA